MKSSKRPRPTFGPEEIMALAALRRAAKRAHFIAYQHGTAIVTRINGKMATIPPDPKMYWELLADLQKKRAEVQAKYGHNVERDVFA
ncbi:MAG: hypothetical protein MPL62_10680 [Alphaproteobacteria bacterium]|nr:hypothetical protein [Alphaproteobacteria bacterium]